MKLSKEKAYDLGAIYDVQSVMHLSGYAFSKNALLPTITIRKTGSDQQIFFAWVAFYEHVGLSSEIRSRDALRIAKATTAFK